MKITASNKRERNLLSFKAFYFRFRGTPMPQTTIRYSIKPNGTVQEIVEGIKGHSCDTLTKPIEEALGDVLTHTHTPDFYTEMPSSQKEYIEYLEDHDWN